MAGIENKVYNGSGQGQNISVTVDGKKLAAAKPSGLESPRRSSHGFGGCLGEKLIDKK